MLGDFLILYKWTIAGGLAGGALLALIGSQLAARNQTVQTLVISQAATLGVVIAIALRTPPLIMSFVFAAFFYLFCELLMGQKLVSRNTYFIGIFSVLMACTYMIIALAPKLESSMTSAYFGDLTVTSNLESKMILAVGIIGLMFFLKYKKQIISWSFDHSVFGDFVKSKKQKLIQKVFVILSLVTISTSIQFLGLLFTLICLFLPTLVLALVNKSVKGFFIQTAMATILGVGVGFLVSLWQGSLPTVPTMAFTLPVASLLIGYFCVAKS